MSRPRPLPEELRLAPFRVSEALVLGATPKQLRSARLHAPFHGVRSSVAVDDLHARCRAYEPLMTADQWFSHATAARLWGIPLPARLRDDDRLHVSTRRREPQRVGVVGHRISARRDVRIHLGFPVSGPADAWCELAATRSPHGSTPSVDDLVIAGDRLIGWPSPLATLEEVDAAIARFSRSRGIRSIVAARTHLRQGSGSPRETVLRRTVAAAPHGFPEPECNGEIVLASRRTHGDLVFRRYRVLLEYDGDQHRTNARQWHRDVDRLNELAAAGWWVIRVHRGTHSHAWIDLLATALRRRGWSAGAE
ncbi:hypothetical protein GCM10009819_36100 [Agromyces tropicus]|uniref:DUF559 domain-containing protein n=1 Tax=Agromyces tropicus TaxID=555371 RepID=A0ABP5GFD5_9MICO